jgi:hypothetical protein
LETRDGRKVTEVGKMTINYLIPLHKPSTRHFGDIVYIFKKCRIERLHFFLRPLEKSRYRPRCFFTLK